MCFVIKSTAFAQISGQVVDMNSAPIEFANVALLALPDSSLICGTTTDEKGMFRLEKSFSLAKDLLKITYIGYENKYVDEFVNGNKIALKSTDIALSEVVVSAQKRIFKSRGIDIIADIQHSPFKDFGSVDDVLDKMPMVSGSNGSYSVFGRENTAIYINRRRITDMSELSRIQSKDIATIEVINNPGVDYDADTHAVIKINLKRNTDNGLGVMAIANDKQGRRNSDNEQVQLTYNTNTTNSFLSFDNSTSRYSTDQNNSEWFKTPSDEWT